MARPGALRVSDYFNQVGLGDGRSLLYSGASLCVDLVPTSYAARLAAGSDLSFLSDSERACLLERGHLTCLSPRREREAFRGQVESELRSHLEPKRRPGRATLSFVLSYNCNLACTYCYQKSLASKSSIPAMTDEFVDKFLSAYLPQLFPDVPRKNILLLLFGGEPLLPPHRKAIDRILSYAKKYSMTVSSPTNATTVGAMADLIGPGKISNVQVTLDGDRTFHDRHRTPRSGRPTFDAIMRAIRLLIERKAYVHIRIHTHPGGFASTQRLIRRLERESILGHPRVDVYFAPLNSFDSDTASDADIKGFRQNFQRVAATTGRPPTLNMEFIGEILETQEERPGPRIRFCSLGSGQARIIDPLGDIYDCYEDAGHRDRRIGTIDGGRLRYFHLRKVYSERSLLNLRECLGCSAAAFCGGGCARQALVQTGSVFEPHCHQHKEYIALTLRANFLNSPSHSLWPARRHEPGVTAGDSRR